MGLPANGIPWPPKTARKELEAIEESALWYSGNVPGLTNFYGSPSRQQKWRSGFFKKRSTTQPDKRLHVPLAADIAQVSADLLFSEAPVISSDDKKVKARLEWLQSETDFLPDLTESAELAAGTGDTFWRIPWDKDLFPESPLIDWVPGSAALPEYKFGRLSAVTFWTKLSVEGNQVWRHVERYEPGVVLHGLYLGTETNLGRAMDLTSHDATKGLAEHLATDGQSVNIPGLPADMMLAGQVPNMRPNRQNPTSRRGRADTAGLAGEMTMLDETWTSWWRDIRLGQARIFAPEQYLKDLGDGKGAAFDVDQELFRSLKMPGGNGTQDLFVQQFAIRVEEHSRTARELTENIVSSAGYSLATFGLEATAGGVAMTATEVNARESKSNKTRGKKARYWEPALRACLTAWLTVDKLMSFPEAVTPADISVSLADSVQEDMETRARTAGMLLSAEAASLKTRLKLVHPDWDQKQIDDEVAEIQGSTVVPVDDSFTGE